MSLPLDTSSYGVKEKMIPLRDHNPSGKQPIVTWFLIAANVLVFLYMLTLSDAQLNVFYNTYSMVPAQIVHGQHLLTLFTSMFLHGGLGHLAGNMLFLHIFGDNLEAEFGHLKYLCIYIVCGLGAALLQILINPASTIPVLGASGAIAGLMGGYLLLFPKNQIDVLFTFGPFVSSETIPAIFMIVYWFAAQLFSGVGSLGLLDSGGVAYFAHIGGFITGFLIAVVHKKTNENPGVLYYKKDYQVE